MPVGVYERTPEIREAVRAAAEDRRVDTGWCQVEGCDKPSAPRRANICEKHYIRQYRREREPARYIKVILRRACPVCGKRFTPRHNKGVYVRHCSDACRRKALLAEKHPSWIGDAVGYAGAHRRLKEQRGLARLHICIDCGAQAQQWSVNRDIDLLKRSEFGPYSPNPQHYDPRCISCHKIYDLRAT